MYGNAESHGVVPDSQLSEVLHVLMVSLDAYLTRIAPLPPAAKAFSLELFEP
jgi:hypothetical protein